MGEDVKRGKRGSGEGRGKGRSRGNSAALVVGGIDAPDQKRFSVKLHLPNLLHWEIKM